MSRDTDLRALVSYGIKRANAAIMGDVERLLGRFGLRRTTFSALSVIAGNARIRQSEVAVALAIEPPNLVQVLDELQRSALIVRARDETDRRAYLLSVTESGAALLAQADTALQAYDARLTRNMSAEERRALIAALRQVEENGAGAVEGRDAGQVQTT